MYNSKYSMYCHSYKRYGCKRLGGICLNSVKYIMYMCLGNVYIYKTGGNVIEIILLFIGLFISIVCLDYIVNTCSIFIIDLIFGTLLVIEVVVLTYILGDGILW